MHQDRRLRCFVLEDVLIFFQVMLQRVLVPGKELTLLNLIYPFLVLIEGSIGD